VYVCTDNGKIIRLHSITKRFLSDVQRAVNLMRVDSDPLIRKLAERLSIRVNSACDRHLRVSQPQRLLVKHVRHIGVIKLNINVLL